LGVQAQNLHYTLLVLVADLEHVILIEEVEVFQRDGSVSHDSLLVFDCLAAESRAFEVISQVDLLGCLEDVVHDTEVHLFGHFASLAIEDDLVKAEYARDHRVCVLACEVLVVVLEHVFHHFEFMPRDRLQQESTVITVVEETARFSR